MERCCNSCAMLACNKNAKSPEASELDWFSQENLDRVWNECRTGGLYLVCHSTDPGAKNYGGRENIKPGNETVCMGLTLWMYMHIKIFEVPANCKFQEYQRLVGKKVAMTHRAMADAALNFATGSTGFGIKGQLRGIIIPQVVNDDREIRYPTGFEKVKTLFTQIIKSG